MLPGAPELGQGWPLPSAQRFAHKLTKKQTDFAPEIFNELLYKWPANIPFRFFLSEICGIGAIGGCFLPSLQCMKDFFWLSFRRP